MKGFKTCKYYAEWNANYCDNEDLGILIFESNDGDFMDRTFSPMIYRVNATGYTNIMNSFMDHLWDGFYTSQKRMSRFPGIIDAS